MEVLNILRHYQLYAKKGICGFGTTHVEYLWHIISKGYATMDTSKVEGVLNCGIKRL